MDQGLKEFYKCSCELENVLIVSLFTLSEILKSQFLPILGCQKPRPYLVWRHQVFISLCIPIWLDMLGGQGPFRNCGALLKEFNNFGFHSMSFIFGQNGSGGEGGGGGGGSGICQKFRNTFTGFCCVVFYFLSTSAYLKGLEYGNSVPRPKWLWEATNIDVYAVMLFMGKWRYICTKMLLNCSANLGNAHICNVFLFFLQNCFFEQAITLASHFQPAGQKIIFRESSYAYLLFRKLHHLIHHHFHHMHT